MEPKFKVGDWCFCEFTLHQITDMDEDRITGVSDGMFNMSSFDLSDQCFPLSLKIKNISDKVKYWSDEFHKNSINGLNHPDLNRELIKKWVELCHSVDNYERYTKLYNELQIFGSSVCARIDELKNEMVGDIKLFR